jgi:translin
MSSHNSTSNLDSIGEKIRAALGQKHQAREAVYPLTRKVVQEAANAIRAVHRGAFDEATAQLKAAKGFLTEIERNTSGHEDLRNTGYVEMAEKEYAEACCVYALGKGDALPDPDGLGVQYPAYLNGLGEAAGELRRMVLDALRKDNVQRCEAILGEMDDIYTMLSTMDFPDALTGNLKRTTDMVRGVTERTRGDLTMALRQARLEAKLSDVEKRLG